MKSHNVELACRLQHFDKYGNIKNTINMFPKNIAENLIRIKSHEHDITFPMRSFNRNMPGEMHYIYQNTSKPTNTIYQLNGGVVSGGVNIDIRTVDIGVRKGILIGTGSNSSSMLTYNVQYECAHGTSTGQMLHGAMTWIAPEQSGSAYRFGAWRPFTNGSSATITISEVKMQSNLTTDSFKFILAYDAIDVSGSAINIAVPSGSTVTVYNYFALDDSGPLNLNFLNIFYSNFASANVTLTPVSGSDTTNNWCMAQVSVGAYWLCVPGTQQSGAGIVVGSGSSNPFHMTGSQLDGIVKHGTGSNELYYGATDVETYIPTLSGTSSMSHGFIRTFVNFSPGPIDLTESGIYVAGPSAVYTEDNKKIMIARNVFDAPITLQKDESIAVTYLYIYNC